MELTARRLAILAGAGSAALLLGALFFQWLGYAPCKLCLWQRWPHGAAIGFGALALIPALPLLPIAILGGLSALTTSGLGLYHTGVERGWWEGPTSCSGSGPGLGGMSGADLLSTAGPADLVMCDEVVWSFLGLSMASWNALLALGLALIWALAARRAVAPRERGWPAP